MDAGIADAINRQTAARISARLDGVDIELRGNMLLPGQLKPWHIGPMADTLMGENDAKDADRAWLVGTLASNTPDVHFDGGPADEDWENLFSHFRAEILARRNPRDPSAPSVRDQSLCGIV